MSPALIAYATLALAICAEVAGSAFLKSSDGFSRLGPTLAVLFFYALAFFFLAQVLRTIPLGVAYAIWSGVGIILTALVGFFVFRQTLDAGAVAGIALIVAGVVVMNVFSRTTGH